VRKVEKNSSKQQKARTLYGQTDLSIRQIAQQVKVDEKTVRNWVKEGSWERGSAEIPQTLRIGEAAARVVERLEAPTQEANTAASEAPRGEPRTATEIAREFCGTIDVLRAEIDTVVRNLHLIRDIAECDGGSDDDKAAEARRKLLSKVLDLPGLVKASNDLTAALSRLTEADPGKKEQQKQNAKSAGTGRFATPSAPGAATDRLQ
jgi:ribosomal protein L31E